MQTSRVDPRVTSYQAGRLNCKRLPLGDRVYIRTSRFVDVRTPSRVVVEVYRVDSHGMETFEGFASPQLQSYLNPAFGA